MDTSATSRPALSDFCTVSRNVPTLLSITTIYSARVKTIWEAAHDPDQLYVPCTAVCASRSIRFYHCRDTMALQSTSLLVLSGLPPALRSRTRDEYQISTCYHVADAKACQLRSRATAHLRTGHAMRGISRSASISRNGKMFDSL